MTNNLITTLLLIDTYGPRMNLESLGKVLGLQEATLRARIAARELGIPTYLDGKMRFADTRDVAAYLDKKREEAHQALAAAA